MLAQGIPGNEGKTDVAALASGRLAGEQSDEVACSEHQEPELINLRARNGHDQP